MRPKTDLYERFRHSGPPGVVNGMFFIPNGAGKPKLKVLVTSGCGWDHVSVSLPDRCPRWSEMQRIKELFFEDEEEAFQLHPKQSNYVNCHPYCLHIWRPNDGTAFPSPDSILV